MSTPPEKPMARMHFERMAADYARARPQYPSSLYQVLRDSEVIGPGIRVLEIGAGSGLATSELVRAGSDVVAIEPGADLAALLRSTVDGVEVLPTTLEGAQLPQGGFDSAVAATAMHWVDLAVGLPKLHAALRPEGQLAVWRNVFGDEQVHTDFRARVAQVVAARHNLDGPPRGPEPPTMDELTDGGWFTPTGTWRWRWSIDLTSDQVHHLFATFSDWAPEEVAAVTRAAADLGGLVTEHYQSVLHLLRRAN